MSTNRLNKAVEWATKRIPVAVCRKCGVPAVDRFLHSGIGSKETWPKLGTRHKCPACGVDIVSDDGIWQAWDEPIVWAPRGTLVVGDENEEK